MSLDIIKEMDESDPQRAKLIEAERIASKIASCESDDQTKRATTMYCLERTIEGFPVSSLLDYNTSKPYFYSSRASSRMVVVSWIVSMWKICLLILSQSAVELVCLLVV
jgi:hypothetical protein